MHGYVLQDGRNAIESACNKIQYGKALSTAGIQYSFLRLSGVAKSVEYSWEYSICILVSDILFFFAIPNRLPRVRFRIFRLCSPTTDLSALHNLHYTIRNDYTVHSRS